MKTTYFNNGDVVIIEMTDYIKNGDKKPTPVKKVLEYTISVDTRGRRYIISEYGKSFLKNFKKGEVVKGSFGMTMYKKSWLNYGYIVLGGIEYKRNMRLDKLISKKEEINQLKQLIKRYI